MAHPGFGETRLGAVVAGAAASVLLASCSGGPFGGGDADDAPADVDVSSLAYCDRVEHFEDQVLSLGRVKTDEAFADYVDVLETIAAEAPNDADWRAWAELTEGFLAAHQQIGFPLADRYDPEKVAALSDEDKTALNNATFVYNVGVEELRPRLIDQLRASCSIDLSTGAPPELDDPADQDGDD